MRAFPVSFEHAQKPQLAGTLAFPDYAQDMSEGFPTQDTRVLFLVFLSSVTWRRDWPSKTYLVGWRSMILTARRLSEPRGPFPLEEAAERGHAFAGLRR